ncbi:hypothetical protein GLE_3426 [Lysobacter enzymogenes]|uniref:Uncharacterized protein n=1 Tax=Lysobacter enzymogenes TaxID=69 RepID=A0A0S2DJR7_LYSEN|nr:hypothetical protein GLE_3426 [Lysobacter enzymogenes]
MGSSRASAADGGAWAPRSRDVRTGAGRECARVLQAAVTERWVHALCCEKM